MVPGFGALGVDAKGVTPPLLIPRQRSFLSCADKTTMPNFLEESVDSLRHPVERLVMSRSRNVSVAGAKVICPRSPPGAPEEGRGAATPGVAMEAEATNDERRVSSSGGVERDGEEEDMREPKRSKAEQAKHKSKKAKILLEFQNGAKGDQAFAVERDELEE